MAWDYYPTSTPRKVEGGIKAHSKRGGFGENWWSKRWIQILESFDIASRLQRGRAYARKGQVISIDISTGKVVAKVQGSSSRPYKVSIHLEPIEKTAERRLADALSGQAIYVANLLAGYMPPEIEQTFKAAGLSLFPEHEDDLSTSCSCPDWSNPCKHIAAVYYLLGEEFDRDPFLLFKLRGLDRARLLSLISSDAPDAVAKDRKAAAQGRNSSKTRTQSKRKQPAGAQPSRITQPLNPESGCFWNGSPLNVEILGNPQPPPVAAPIVKRLGGFPFWQGSSPLLETLEPIYRDATIRGQKVFSGEALLPED